MSIPFAACAPVLVASGELAHKRRRGRCDEM